MNSDLKAMTFNLRFASDTPPNSWLARRPVLNACLRQSAPDVIGTQEGIYSQLKDIARDRPEFQWIGLGREGGSKGEFIAVFFRTARLEPLDYDFFWLSDSPDFIASKTWGNKYIRMAMWIRFRDLQTGREFGFWNTHFDHQFPVAREKSAHLILEKMKEHDASLPLIFVGDFNAAANSSAAYDILREGGFSDSWLAAKQRPEIEISTFHNYAPISNGARIDWILTRGKIETRATEIVTFEQNGQRPSDHFPVSANLIL